MIDEEGVLRLGKNMKSIPIDEMNGPQRLYPPVLDEIQEKQNNDETIMEEFKTAINSYNEHGYDPKGLPAFLTGWFGEKNPICHITMANSVFKSV